MKIDITWTVKETPTSDEHRDYSPIAVFWRMMDKMHMTKAQILIQRKPVFGMNFYMIWALDQFRSLNIATKFEHRNSNHKTLI